MDKLIVARWRDWAGESMEYAVIRAGERAIVVDSVLVSAGDSERFGVRYHLECDPGWILRKAAIAVVGADSRIELNSDGRGCWADGAGRRLSHLDGAIDIDLSVTPLTNTLAIRRMGLAVGRARDIRAAYVRFPGLDATIDPQRYTCLEGMRRYLYESLDSDFVREIEVDPDGLVVTYPGLFKRIL